MNAHNICFHGEVRKISIFFDWKKSTLSRAMLTRKLTVLSLKIDEIHFIGLLTLSPLVAIFVIY